MNATKSWVVAVALFSTLFGVWANGGFHIFTDGQGRKVTAKIIHVDSRRDVVELELENKRRKKVNPSVFIEADQIYIRDWVICNTFISSSGLRFSAEKEVVEDWSETPATGIIQEFEKNIYNCELKNGSAVAFKNIKVEYCVYWVQEIQQGGEEECLELDFSGQYDIPGIEPRATARFQTTPVILIDQSLQGGFYYAEGGSDKQDSKMKGVWVKVSMTTAAGKIVTHDFCEPSDVMKRQVWKAPKISKPQESKKKKKGSKKNNKQGDTL